MPRPLLNHQKTITESKDLLSLAPEKRNKTHTNSQMDKLQVDRLLRKPRSKEYMEALRKLDAGGHVQNQNQVNEIINIIKSEFPELEITNILLGYVSICYLGKPYEVHTLTMMGGIIEHYKKGQILPNGLEKARTIAMRGGYEFIEVYVDHLRAISANGSVSVIHA